ncbi:FtsX-like permease family protein [bacterium]|nr:FtsX-like permease family protein [bacterium]MBU1638406.1 FtsX-like permease family protein [bacterium]MBU1919246.1 FtsX-like permease family protein [bacterium]
MNWLFFKLGVRNVIRQRRRSLFNVLTLGVNTSMLILLIGILRGFYVITIDKTIDLRTGHLQIHKQGYEQEKRRLPLDITIAHSQLLKDSLETLENVVAASPKVIAAAAISNGRERTAVLLNGVYPASESRVGVILNSVVKGKALSDSSWGILIGDRLAELLDVEVGSSLLLYARTQQNANNLLDAEVIGIFDSGFDLADRTMIYAPIAYTNALLDMQDEVTEIVIRAPNYRTVPFLVDDINQLDARLGYDSLLVEPWYVIAKEVVAGIKADLVSYAIIGIILVILAVFGITNTMTVSVYERTAEIGALRALGMEKKQVHRMFLAEGIALGIGGTIIGILLGLVFVWYMSKYGIALPKDAVQSISFPLGDHFYAKSQFIDWVIGSGLALLCALAGAVFPARRASNVPVTSALARGVR